MNKLMREDQAPPHTVVTNSSTMPQEMELGLTWINTESPEMPSSEAHPSEKAATLRSHETLRITQENFRGLAERRVSHLLEKKGFR